MIKFLSVLSLLLSILVLTVAQALTISGVPAQWNIAATYAVALNGGLPPYDIWLSDSQGNRLEFLMNQTYILDPTLMLNPGPLLALGNQYYIGVSDLGGFETASPLFELVSLDGSSASTGTASCPSFPVSTTTVTVTSIQSVQLGSSPTAIPTFSCPSLRSSSLLTVTKITETKTETLFATQNDTTTKDDKTTITITETSAGTKKVTTTVTVTATKTKG
ncbi:hypothetical protein L207DRAFT_512431 [Hyaloscypha variabilis F]|uniref:Uncharacterized protein n=1 Tax=Hyaloscypha variabilis (strain UAMH 11265 / GT02V1 / F) TaxID=1149755 RepID=A0A2J6RR96_HYAVF|nr:hypothetical protein L207DRAFT_512431 [Hyaloscypha variabilis F]